MWDKTKYLLNELKYYGYLKNSFIGLPPVKCYMHILLSIYTGAFPKVIV